MAKNRLATLVLSSIVAFGVMTFSNSSKNNNYEVAFADEKVYFEFDSINWNNVDYVGWSGPLTEIRSPENGYCMLAFFNEQGKTYSESKIGDLTDYNAHERGLIVEEGNNVSTTVTINGVNIVDVAGSKCYIYPHYGLFFYVPEASLSNKETYLVPTIEFKEGLHIGNSYLPKMSFEFRGKLGDIEKWTYLKDDSEYNKFPFTGVPEAWNNISYDATHNQNVLQFGQASNDPTTGAYNGDYLKNDKISADINLVNQYSECGRQITVNGIPLYQIKGSSVTYLHGYCYVFLILPLSALNPSNGYKVTTLHIEQDVKFYDSMLGEAYLYLFNGRWITERPETVNDSEYTNAYTLSSVFENATINLNSNNNQISATKESTLATFGLYMDYKLKTNDSAFVLYAVGKTNLSGLRVVFINNMISLYDSTQGNVLLGEAELSPFNFDEWYSLFLYTRVVSNKLEICLAVDEIIYIHLNNVLLSNQSNIGNSYSITLGNGEASFTNTRLGEDNKKPVITYSGKKAYGLTPNSDVTDFFKGRYSSYDTKDGDITEGVVVNWPNNSLTDNKVNKGTWEVEISSTDSSGNTATVYVTIIVKNKLDVVVTFDGENPTSYRVGDCIACVPDPVKEGDDTKSYRFIGWYYGTQLWDFENDYVVSDMNLESRFQESVVEHCVSFTVEGLSTISSYTMYFKHGTKLNMQVFEKEGYTLKAYLNDDEVEQVTVNKDMSIKLVYKSTKPQTTSNGCGGNISTTATLLTILSGVGFILLVSLKKKGGKEHE